MRHKSSRLILACTRTWNLNNKEIGIPESFQMCLNGGVFGHPDLKRHLNEDPVPVNQYLIPVVLVEIYFQRMIQYFVSKLTK